MCGDDEARREQVERWREEIEAAKSGRTRPPTSPREFTDPRRRDPTREQSEEPGINEEDDG